MPPTTASYARSRCALLIPRRGKRMRKLALHPALPADVIKSMLQAL